MPTISARRNVPVRGQPIAVPVSASTSSIVRSFLEHQPGTVQTSWNADAVGNKVRRVVREDYLFAENAGRRTRQRRRRAQESRLRRGDDFHQAHVARRIEEVRAEKARLEAPSSSARAAAISQPAGRVLVVRMAFGLRFGITFLSSADLMAISSVTASMTQSQFASLARSSSKVPVETSAAPAASKKAAGLALSKASSDCAASGLAPSFPGRSKSSTGIPALAKCAAMREPMVPAPSTQRAALATAACSFG